MPASFASSLGGYREKNGNPNASDNADGLSKELGIALFDEIGVPRGQVVGDDPGNDLENAIIEDLAPQRRDLDIRRSRSAVEFEQYRHLAVFPQFRSGYVQAAPQIAKLQRIADSIPDSPPTRRLGSQLSKAAELFQAQDEIAAQLIANMPEESFLGMDITVGQRVSGGMDILHLALSSKWSLRTDRAQDCISQGSKLASQRRGAMPHYAVITIEPRPAMLKILADGSGAIDCVYHLDLPALTRAMTLVRATKGPKWSPGLTFDRLIQQRRLRDYDDLVNAVRSIPRSAEGTATVQEAAQVD